MIELGRAWPCAYFVWSSGRDSKSRSCKSGVQSSGVGENNDKDQMARGSAGAGDEANVGDEDNGFD
jgi:hypothetical protein